MKINSNTIKQMRREIDGFLGNCLSTKKSLQKVHQGHSTEHSLEKYKSMRYSKESHFPLFHLMPIHKNQNPSTCDLKVYQDLFIYSFIIDHMPKGSKILEIGGGESRVITALCNDYEFWNLDMLEGAGHGPTNINLTNDFHLVKDNIGNFSKVIPDKYFDLVFSISVIEHFPEDDVCMENIIQDLKRVSKKGGAWAHCIDAILFDKHIWYHPFIQKLLCENKDFDIEETSQNILLDKDLWVLPKFAYYTRWYHKTHKSYKSFGHPFSINIFSQTA